VRKKPRLNLEKGRSKYSFHIYNVDGKRKQVMTGESDRDIAQSLIDEYTRIVGLSQDDDIALAVDERIYKAYFNKEKSKITLKTNLTEEIFTKKEIIALDKILDVVEGIDESLAETFTRIMVKIPKLLVSHDERGKTIQKLIEEVKGYEDLKRSVIAKQINAANDTGTLSECIDKFELEYRDTVSYSTCVDILSMNRRFAKKIPDDISPAEVSKAQIKDFIMELAKKSPDPEYRKKRVRSMLSVFFTWAADRYEFQNPITGLVLLKKKITKKKKIIWHDLNVIEDMLLGLDSYWSAIVATMAYAGIGLKELSGIRVDDFTKATKQINDQKAEVYFLKIEWHDERGLKTKNRSDSVPVDAKYLLPHLLKFIEDGHVGEKYFFAKPNSKKELWTNDALSRKLNGRRYSHEGKKDTFTKPILANKIKARDLRHTFGSLLIRNGYSIDEACALTRNKREVFMEHYGHLTAKELHVTLSGDEAKVKYIDEAVIVRQ